ncbi:MAG: excinuclease ABC subunit UvrC [Candidatus Dormibacteria bacterium]
MVVAGADSRSAGPASLPIRPGSAAAAGSLLRDPELLRARLAAVPQGPGVYLFRSASAQVAYVGKSANLRDRLRSYFVAPQSHPARIRRLVESSFDFEVVATGTEQEALILENTLIKRHHPRFNVRLRDDKSYLYFHIPQPQGPTGEELPATMTERLTAFPRPGFTRRLGADGGRYFGPYTDSKGIRRSVRELRAAVPFRGCADPVFRRGRVCLDYHIGICAGPCEGRISPAAHQLLLDDAAAFLSGHTGLVRARLEAAMGEASERLEFELAASLRDRVRAVEKLTEEQVTAPRLGADVDLIGLATTGGQGLGVVMLVREGRLQGVERHLLEGVGEVAVGEVLASFLAQHYASSTHVPRAVLVPDQPAGIEVLGAYLESRRGGRVDIRVPKRGSLRHLLGQAGETAEAALTQSRVTQDFDSGRVEAVLADLQLQLGLVTQPRRIECYDISNTMGNQSVGSMVVFEDARPKVSDYRIFSIRTVTGPNDFASMGEVIFRRFTHLAGATPEGGASLGVMPDLVIVDGGAGQLAFAHRALEQLGLADIPHFGLAKRFEQLHQVGGGEPVHLPEGSPALFLVQRVRDEAHRFAITRHRSRRQKASLHSRLDEVTGLGPKRKKALLTRFGSVAGIKQASLEELIAVPGVTRPVASAIKELL